MGQNSIRDNLTKEDIIAEIRLALNADFSHSISVVIVEGADDVVFFNGKLHLNADIIESYSGKTGVIELVDYFDDNRVIGICDRDYDSDYKNEKIFYYDYSCLEMMMVSADLAFYSFVYTYFPERLPPDQIRLAILSDLQLLSVSRQLNAEENWGVRFSGLSIMKAFDKTKQKLDYASVLQQLKNTNPELKNFGHGHLCMIRQKSIFLPSELKVLLSITNGHDFLHYFHALCCCSNPKYKSSASDISRGLSCSFRVDDFKKTKLYEELAVYQEKEGVTVL